MPRTNEKSSSLPLTGGVCGIFEGTTKGTREHSTSLGSKNTILIISI